MVPAILVRSFWTTTTNWVRFEVEVPHHVVKDEQREVIPKASSVLM